MGTKRTSWSSQDTLPLSTAASERSSQSSERHPIRREVSPRPGPRTHPSREREEEQRRYREMERTRERRGERGRDTDQEQWDRYRERERFQTFKGREEDTERRERDRRRDGERRANGRVVSMLEHGEPRERRRRKGDTLPRMRSQEREGARFYLEPGTGRAREAEMTERERERERERARKRDRDLQKYRELERERDRERARMREEWKKNGGRRPENEETERRRERGLDYEPGTRERRERRERDAEINDPRGSRERERERERERDREARFYSPLRRKVTEGERGNYSDREGRDERRREGRREGRRDTKSEGDSEEERERERGRDTRTVKLKHKHSRSEGDNEGERTRERMRERERLRQMEKERERERTRERDNRRQRGNEGERERGGTGRDVERYAERERDREWDPDRRRDGARETQGRRREDGQIDRTERERENARSYASNERERYTEEERAREREKHSERRERRDREREERRERERQRAGEDRGADRGSRSPTESQRERRTKPQSSGEWISGSDTESDLKGRGPADSYEEKERESTLKRDRRKEERESAGGQDVSRGQKEGADRENVDREGEKPERERERESQEEKPVQRTRRKMWLEPRQGRERASSSLEDEFAEKERSRYTFADRYRERESVREEEQERYVDRQSRERETDRKRPEDWYRERERAGEFVWDEKKERENERRRGVGRKDDSAERGSDAEYGNEPNWQGDREGQTERENATDNTEESDREEEEGEGGYGRYEESEDGSEDVWEGEGERERAAATDDGFVTVSSGGEGEDEYEEKFEDCAEFWDTGVTAGQTHRANETQGEPEGEGETKQGTEEEKADETVTVFCLIGQTNLTDRMTEGEANQHSGLDNNAANADQEIELNAEKHPGNDSEKDRDNSSQGTEEKREGRSGATSTSMEETKEKDYNPKEQETQAYEDMTPSENPKASANERTGTESELHPLEHPEGPEDCGRDVEGEKTTAQAVRSEQREDGEGRMEEHFQVEETWTTAEERKRQSGPPHLKWAKNVIREYLGSSEEGVLAVPESADPPTDVPPGQSQAEAKEEGAETPIYAAVDKTAKHKRRVDSDPLPGVTEKEKGNQEHTHLDTHLQTESEREADGEALLIPGEGEPEMEEDLEDYRGGMEGETDEEWDSDKVSLFKHDKQYLSSDQLTHSSEGESEKEGGKKEKKEKKKKGGWSIISSNSFRDLGSEARTRRKGFRKTTERKREEEESGEGVGRDRRPIVLNTSEDDDEDHLRFSWGEVDIRNVTDTLGKMRKRNSKFYNAQLYQQYSEVVQNREILRQSRSDAISIAGDVPAVAPPPPSSPAPSSSPPPACRPLPPIPHVPHPHSLSHSNSFSSVSSLPVPTSAGQGGSRPPSPRLSVSSLSQSPTLWQDLPGVRNTPELAALTEDERRLQEVRFEMVTSEASYCRSLDIVVEHFVKSKPLNSLLGSQDRNWLFSRLGDVRAISHRFLAKLEGKVENDVMGFTVCDVIIEHSQRFRMVYVPYLTNQSYQDKTYQRLMDENAGFRRVVEKLERSPLCQRLPLRSFLILPFQRITRLKLLVQNIAKRTAPKTKDESQAIKAMKLLEKIIQDGNDSINQMKSIESLVSLSAKVDFECKTLPLISQSRRLVREGPVTELRDFSAKEKERSAYLHLFNDHMLFSLCKEGGRFTVIDHAPVSDLRAENCRVKLHSLQKNLFVLYMGNKSLLVRADTQSDKLRWISALSRPHPEIDFTAAQDFAQMQCIRAFVAQQPDELTLEKADVLLVHQQSSDGWVEGTRLSDRQRGWAPESHLEIISSQRARKRNLQDALKISNATAAV